LPRPSWPSRATRRRVPGQLCWIDDGRDLIDDVVNQCHQELTGGSRVKYMGGTLEPTAAALCSWERREERDLTLV
jgi:hypothetical protein